ncbi:MAG: hypothetical protein WBF77_12895 [Sulfurimonadaceae bacterium]
MKKMIKITLASAVSMLLLAGCSAGGIQTAEESMSGGYELTLKGHTKTETVHDAIMEAGEATGLKMTEFKSNAIIAEKVDGDDSASATVTFTNDKIIIMQETGDIDADDLLKAIVEELEKEDSH